MWYRLVVLFFTVATIVLSAWALVGSYDNKPYLTNNYLISFQLSDVNLSSIFKVSNLISKRELLGTDIRAELGGDNIIYDVVVRDDSEEQEQLLEQDVNIQVQEHKQNQIQKHVAEEPEENHKLPSYYNLKLVPTKTLEARDFDIGGLTAVLPGVVPGITSLVSEVLDGGATSAAGSIASAYGVATPDITSALANVNTASLISQAQAFASTASIPDAVASIISQVTGDLSSILENIVASAKPSDLGLADMYAVGFYGYCRGDLTGKVEDQQNQLGALGKQFRNNNVNYTYCSPPVFGYKLDPLELLKHEMLGSIRDYANKTNTLTHGLTDKFFGELLTVVSSLTYENIGLPGDLQNYLGLLHRATIAGFSLLFAGTFLAFISLVFQLIGITCSPQNTCLSCCNFFLMLLVAVVVVVGAGLNTGVFLFVRKILKANLADYNVNSFLSQQFYAFAWSAAVSAIVFIILSIIGYCCGFFRTNRTRRRFNTPEPEFRYDHKG